MLVSGKECGRTSSIKPRLLFTDMLYCLVSVLAIDGLLPWLLKEIDFQFYIKMIVYWVFLLLMIPRYSDNIHSYVTQVNHPGV